MITVVGSTDLPQLVLIHGGGVGAWMWEDCIPLLSSYYQLLIVTLPYHGDTTYGTAPFTITDYSDNLLSQLQQYRNDQQIGIVGFSLGAQISLALLTIAPTMFSFAMINSALCTPIHVPFKLIKVISVFFLPLAKLRLFAKLQAKVIYLPDSMFERYYQLSSSITAQQLAEILHTNMSYECSASIGIATADIHITYGKKEISAIKKSASVIHQLLPLATIQAISKIGHGFPLADAPAFSNYILKHFRLMPV